MKLPSTLYQDSKMQAISSLAHIMQRISADPEEITAGHVGDMARLNADLADILAYLPKREPVTKLEVGKNNTIP